jgi:hypothetical protein
MKSLIISTLAAGFLLTSTSSAQIVIGQLGVLDDTSGLSAGQQYRLVFVTSTTTTATSANIGDYNTFVQGVANTAGYGSVNWFAVGSTLTVDARDNTSTNPGTDGAGVAIFNFDSLKIADNNSDLWDGDIDNAINVTETGGSYTGEYWSGSVASGTADTGTGWVLGSTGGSPNLTRVGNNTLTDATWISGYRRNNANNQRILAMSEILTVPIPEPSSFALIALGGLTLAMLRRRRS